MLRRLYFLSTKSTIAAEHVKRVEDTLEMLSTDMDAFRTRTVFTRVGQDGNGVYYDLGLHPGSFALIKAESGWFPTMITIFVSSARYHKPSLTCPHALKNFPSFCSPSSG